jgi:hypothetical protein
LLTAYLTSTRSLLQLPGSNSTSLYSDADLTRFVNTARGQVAGEGACIRAIGTIPTVAAQQAYNFADIGFGNSGATGIQGPINIRRLAAQVGLGQLWMTFRPWDWFTLYELNNVVPETGMPRRWSQLGQGAAPSQTGIVGGGSFFVAPVPDNAYTLNVDCVCYPIPLLDDTTVEALPYFWTDAVPFFAAYFALMSAQTNARMADAAQMYKGHYGEFMDRARKQANMMPNRWQSDQAGDPAQGPKMGISKGGAG